jgi:REP element-mobilizing transposase RayT
MRHVVARGNGRMRIFLDDEDYRRFTFDLGEIVEEYRLECWSYCLMPNHYHLALRPTLPNLSAAMRHLNSEYAKNWNRRHQRVGHVFQGRFKDQLVQNGRYLFALCRYIALNPVRAGLVTKPEAWAWGSSRAIYGLQDCPSFLAAERTLQLFGSGDIDMLRARFAEFVLSQPADETPYDRIRSNERIIGDRDFKRTVDPSQAQGEVAPPAASPLEPATPGEVATSA